MNQISEGIITVFILSLITVGFFYSVIAHDNAELSISTTIPEPYYTGVHNPDLTSHDLITLLDNFTSPHEYIRWDYDCTQAAAYMEWYLTNRGYDAELAIVRTAFGYHGIVVVHLKDRDEGIINNFNPAYYYGPPPTSGEPSYGTFYKDIYEACEKGTYSEWDWWTEVNFTAVNS